MELDDGLEDGFPLPYVRRICARTPSSVSCGPQFKHPASLLPDRSMPASPCTYGLACVARFPVLDEDPGTDAAVTPAADDTLRGVEERLPLELAGRDDAYLAPTPGTTPRDEEASRFPRQNGRGNARLAPTLGDMPPGTEAGRCSRRLWSGCDDIGDANGCLTPWVTPLYARIGLPRLRESPNDVRAGLTPSMVALGDTETSFRRFKLA